MMGRKIDRILYVLHKGKMTQIGQPTPIKGLTTEQVSQKHNFLIVCDFGDWSGFRTLQECVNQFPELESYGRDDGYYRVVERY